MLIEDITSISYPQLMQELVLGPAEMHHSLFDHQFFLEHPDQIALPYNADGKRFEKAPIISPIYSTGLLWTTAKDLSHFAIAVQRSLQCHGKLISQNLAEELVNPSSTATRGLGFFIGDKYGNEKHNGKYFFHSGNNIGYLSFFIASRDGKFGAVILINTSSEWGAKDQLQFSFIKKTISLIVDSQNWD